MSRPVTLPPPSPPPSSPLFPPERRGESSGDGELLSAWTGRRDHAAFRALVGKYSGLVYGTALRKLRRPEWAEEVMQEVFVVFARKSRSLRGDGGLAGWLHRTAVLRSAARWRAETRHGSRIQRLAAELEINGPPQTAGNPVHSLETGNGGRAEADWQRLHPLLDEALASLPEEDRRVVMLHYFDHKTYAEIGILIGLSHEAARKRGLRALEKLSRRLRRKGVTLPVAAVGAGLATALEGTASPAAAAALGISAGQAASMAIAAITLGGIGPGLSILLSTSLLLTMKSTATTIAVTAVLVAAAGSAGVWWGRNQGKPTPQLSTVMPKVSGEAPPPQAQSAARAANRNASQRVVLDHVPGGPAVPPVPVGPKNSKPPPLDPALKDVFTNHPRTKKAELRINAFKQGYKGLLDQQLVPLKVKMKQEAEAQLRLRDPSLTPAQREAAGVELAKWTVERQALEDGMEAFRIESESWLQYEVMVERDSILAEITQAGGASAPPPAPEPETPQAHNFPEYRAASGLMKAAQYPEALEAFTAMARDASGDLRAQSLWHAMLCGMITGNADAVESSSLPLLRSTPASACFAMAAKAIQRNEWGDAQIWVTQAFKSGDTTESAMFQDSLRELGWAQENSNVLIPPPKENNSPAKPAPDASSAGSPKSAGTGA